MEKKLEQLLNSAKLEIEGVQTTKELEDIRLKFLKKNGPLAEILGSLSQLPVELRPTVGKIANQVKIEILELLEVKKSELEKVNESKKLNDWDPTRPGRKLPLGHRHPLTQVLDHIYEIFKNFGFHRSDGPEIESDYYNFLALNFSIDHPARDAHDTFYVSDDLLMRTHTSPIQIRVMQSAQPPFKIIAPGRVYRHEAIDATHHHVFHQVEGFLVDEGVHFGHLKGILDVFVKEFFGQDVETRFRPSFFPFTEPSAEVDISCIFCGGNGCKICKNTGWVEMMGCGMIHPVVLKNCKIDTEKWSGFAFGMGVERIAMFKYRIDDIRMFYQNDLRFLHQF